MKNISIYIILSFAMYFVILQETIAQNVIQRGIAYRYNGKKPRTPLGGVFIKAVASPNGVLSNEEDGSFTISFNNLSQGSRIGSIKVLKKGMMIFNQQAVDEWSIRKEPLTLILCDANFFQKQKETLISIGRREAKKKYEKQLALLEKENKANKLQLDEYYFRIDSLESKYQNSIKHMHEYAEMFVRIDESEVDTIAQRAIDLFYQGQLDEAIQLLERGNYLDKVLQEEENIKLANSLKVTAMQSKQLAEQDREDLIISIRSKVKAYQSLEEWDKARGQLKLLADYLNTDEALIEYADFCRDHGFMEEAETYYQRVKNISAKRQNINNKIIVEQHGK